MYLLGGLAGLAFGVAAAYCNSLITKHSLKKAEAAGSSGAGAVTGGNLLRQLVNLAALVLVFLLRKINPLPFTTTIIGTAIGLSAGGILFVWLLARKMDRS